MAPVARRAAPPGGAPRCAHLIHLHASLVVVMPKADDHHTRLLLHQAGPKYGGRERTPCVGTGAAAAAASASQQTPLAHRQDGLVHGIAAAQVWQQIAHPCSPLPLAPLLQLPLQALLPVPRYSAGSELASAAPFCCKHLADPATCDFRGAKMGGRFLGACSCRRARGDCQKRQQR